MWCTQKKKLHQRCTGAQICDLVHWQKAWPNPLILKERAEKLESWRKKEQLREQKKTEKKDLLRQQSSMWISEENLDKRILEAIVDTTPL
ncbi:hypothetical protein MA16_Dca009708 [Dendrobium catenatum]|uniref:Uncharacterized protein n=1 Tax=Dendrobium catenatum TaxID=906689 RepID=A0A2I0VQI4_9ASPA|nr:hypothetical protein MA16_Dca009708 [Dendrobium catenatum]